MKILALSDVESRYLWDFYEDGKLKDLDLVISCGDLKAEYLSFIATYTKAPVLYVHGNHDESYDQKPPEGCICIDGDMYIHEGIRIVGLGGSMLYNYGTKQYSERQMRRRVLALAPTIAFHRGFDILVSHAPAYGINDADNLSHRGFKVFTKMLDRSKPKYFIHGHMHLSYNHKQPRIYQYNENTTIINAYERYEFEY
ncbi:MAG: metallophosphoesterase [Eubacterium sp.]|nr:metallophosphoesterase [Eubacterium sp.]